MTTRTLSTAIPVAHERRRVVPRYRPDLRVCIVFALIVWGLVLAPFVIGTGSPSASEHAVEASSLPVR